jgi:hypothetical protein
VIKGELRAMASALVWGALADAWKKENPCCPMD